ncbi:hypothetical protein [Aggregatimonas sangjinii]|nr:hypothetical protein [Aggregatimonas sangjinii]
MKKQNLLFFVLFCIVLQSCCPWCEDDVGGLPFESRYEPVFLSRAEFEQSVGVTNPLSIGTSGKIYVKGDFLFVNELNKGFHVFDNSDPSNPRSVKFLEAPGATDMAIRNDIIYINQATDLIAVEYVSESNTARLAKRIPSTFPELLSPDGFTAYDIPENSVVVDWKLKN